MRWKIVAVLAALAAGAGLLFIPQPSLEARLNRVELELDSLLTAREVMIDPGELLDLVYNNNIAVKIYDVRDEADFNLFHIVDSVRISGDKVRDPVWVRNIPQQTVLMLVSNDEKRAIESWKLLKTQNVQNLYILDGGINHWLDVYSDPEDPSVRTQRTASHSGVDALRYPFDAALG